MAARTSSTKKAPLLRYTAIVFLTYLTIYGVLLVVSYLAFPSSRGSEIDTNQAGLPSALFISEPKYLLFRAPDLDRAGARILVIGSSNVREGLRPAQLEARLGTIEVDNLALSSSNIRQVGQVVDLVYDEIPQQSWPQTTFVLGIWYAMFAPDERCYPTNVTDLDIERLRYGLYRRNAAGFVERRFPKAWTPVLGEALRPVLLVSRMYQGAISPLLSPRVALLRLIGETPPDFRGADRNSLILGPEERKAALLFWHRYMGPPGEWDETGLPRLLELAHKISGRGSRLVILDLPIPTWHREAVPQFTEYQRRKQAFLQQAEKLPGVTYASMQDSFSDDDFYDSAHPRPRVTGRWAEQAAEAILHAVPDSRR